MKYRAEVDGLRAIAVIPVILFHAGFEAFSGGFVGVDVFFVISGYLITTIILTEREQNRFSLVNFYERRARRILPALFLVMLVSLPLAWMWLWPSDLKDYAQSLVAVSLFASNILFWQETGYWGVENELKPMLHTWSLAVEEQYYLLFPLFLALMWKFPRRWIFISFVAVATASFVTAQWGAYNSPTATFFLLPTRGWELAIGAGIAFYFVYRNETMQRLRSRRILSEIFGIIGLILIGYAIVGLDESIPFPSAYALIPTIGAALIIMFASTETIAGKVLTGKILVGIGLISYSAYLWHQPLFAFARHRSLTEPSEPIFAALALLSLALAFLTWKYIETPFRDKTLITRRSIFSFTITGSILFITIGFTGHIMNGFDKRTTSEGNTIDSIQQKWTANHGLSKTCEGTFTLSPECRTSDKPEILIWGDSYAMHLVQGIQASNPNAEIIQITKSVCGPFFDVAPVYEPKYPNSWADKCLEFTDQVRQWLTNSSTIKYVVLSSPFFQYIGEGRSLRFRNGKVVPANMGIASKELQKTLEEITSLGITPVIFSPPPANDYDLGRCLGRAEWLGLSLSNCDFPLTHMSEKRIEAYNLLKTVSDKYRVISIQENICKDSMCRTHLGNTFLFRDTGHLSHEGSAKFGAELSFYKLITSKITPH